MHDERFINLSPRTGYDGAVGLVAHLGEPALLRDQTHPMPDHLYPARSGGRCGRHFWLREYYERLFALPSLLVRAYFSSADASQIDSTVR